jgi:malonyl CoA-acyl carrier protein transacylase
MSNVTAQVFPRFSSDAIKMLLVRQMTEPVRWMHSIKNLRHIGNHVADEIGPGDALTKLLYPIQALQTKQ